MRWKSRLHSVNAVRNQVNEIREALMEARQAVSDSAAKVEARALAEEVASSRFIFCAFVWCHILTITNRVNKLLQIDLAVRLIDSAKSSLSNYRNSGSADAPSAAKDLCDALNIEPELKEKRFRNTKRHMRLEVTFFNSVVDSALVSLEERFETLSQVKDRFGVLLGFSKIQEMSKDDLPKHCTEVQKTLTAKGTSDIDGAEMVQKIMNLP